MDLPHPFVPLKLIKSHYDLITVKSNHIFSLYRCKDNCIVPTRMRQLCSVVQHLYTTVCTSLSSSGNSSSGGSNGGEKKSKFVLFLFVI